MRISTGWGLKIGVAIIIYLVYKTGLTPPSPDYIPPIVNLSSIGNATYCDHYVVIAYAVVFQSDYFMERCVFQITDSSGVVFTAVSPRFRPVGAEIRNTIFWVEPITCSGQKCSVLLREVKQDN